MEEYFGAIRRQAIPDWADREGWNRGVPYQQKVPMQQAASTIRDDVDHAARGFGELARAYTAISCREWAAGCSVAGYHFQILNRPAPEVSGATIGGWCCLELCTVRESRVG